MNKKINIMFVLLFFVGLIGVIFLVLFLIKGNDGNIDNEIEKQNIIKENINDSINEVKELNGLTFESTKIVYQNGMSTLTTKVTINYSVDYDKENFKIIIKDKNKNDIISLPGFIIGGLKANESKNIVSVVDIDLSSDAYYIEYEEVE